MVSLKCKQGLLIVVLSVCATSSAYGTIDNTVTVTGSGVGPNGEIIEVTAQATETVDVVDSNADLEITKTFGFSTGNNNTVAEAGEKITYIFAVKNTGNVTIKNVEVLEGVTNATGLNVVPVNPTMHEDVAPSGDTTDTNLTDSKWDVLAPGDTVHFEADYMVLQSDVDTLQN